MNRFRRGRPDTFTMISNVAIDRFDDLVTVGLLAKLLRLPDNYRLTMDELSARVKGTSRKTLYACMRDLVDKGYVVKVKYQNAKGHWYTDTYTFDPPCTPEEAADIDAQYVGMPRVIEPCWLDPAWIAQQPGGAPQPSQDTPPPYATRVSPAQTDLSNRQVGATRENVENPSSDRPAANRPVGDRPVGGRQALSKTPTKTEEETPSSSGSVDTPANARRKPTRRQEETSRTQTQPQPGPTAVEAATGVLEALPARFMKMVNISQRRDLVRHLVPRLEAGWTPSALLAELTRDFNSVDKPVGLWIYRLKRLGDLPPDDPDTGWGAPEPGPDPVPQAPGTGDGAWCGQCTSPSYRFIENDPTTGAPLETLVRCSCHPSSGPRRHGTRDADTEAGRAAAILALSSAYPDDLMPTH